MKISYNALNTFFDGKLPSPEVLGEAFTFHSWEIEEIVPMEGDTMIDVKVLPDKSAWALSHRGIAKDLSVILDVPLSIDPLGDVPNLSPVANEIQVTIGSPTCTRYTAALIRGVTVAPSPEWLVSVLKTLGQRSINNIVDITNYVMFMTGQPLHAFDAGKLSGTSILVRNAAAGEKITTLTGETYELSVEDTLIVDKDSDTPIGIAGIKGGKSAEVTDDTVDVLLEAAHFLAVPVRKTSQRLSLRTDASARYENGIVPDMPGYGQQDAVKHILEIAGGTLVGYVDTRAVVSKREPVSVSTHKINSVLGLPLTTEEIESIVKRFGYPYTLEGELLTITPPFERTDLNIEEDVIEEIGRIHGYADVPSITPEPLPLREINKRLYYSEIIRDTLTSMGFSEVYTSSFRNTDEVKLKNAFASDKGYLRSTLRKNMEEALQKNIPHKDLLGIPFVGIFEIGTIFKQGGEVFEVALGVRYGSEYKEKTDLPKVTEALRALEDSLGSLEAEVSGGIATFDFGALLLKLPMPEAYTTFEKGSGTLYKSFSPYPSMSRDIAFWVQGDREVGEIETILKETAGGLCVRLSLFDTFSKDGRTSYAFRFVFQSYEKTLTDEEIHTVMDRVYTRVKANSWEAR